MATVKEILTEDPAEDESRLRYNDKQIEIITHALEAPEKTVAELFRYLQDEMEDPPSQGYIYSILNRASSEEFKAATGQFESLDAEAPETESSDDSIETPEEEKESSQEPVMEGRQQSETINISISIPEDSELEVQVEDEDSEDEDRVIKV